MNTTLRPRLTIAVVFVILFVGLLSVEGNAQKLSRKEVKTLIATAKTASDHERLAAYYRDEAASLTAEESEHEEELKEYYANSSRYPGKYPSIGDHCRELAGYYKMAAHTALVMADVHGQLAKTSPGTEVPAK